MIFNGSVAIFKEIFDQILKKICSFIFLFLTKTSSISLHYIYYHTDNIHIVLENDNTVLIKGLKGCKC